MRFPVIRHPIWIGLLVVATVSGCRFFLSPAPNDSGAEELSRDASSVWSLTYSADGSLLLSSHIHQCCSSVRCSHLPGPTRFDLWSTSPLRQGHLATFHAPNWRFTPTQHRFSSDGRFVFSAAFQGLLQWDVTAQRLEMKFPGDHIVLAPDCRTAIRVAGNASIDDVSSKADPTVELWDLTLDWPLQCLGTERTFGSPIEFLPDGQRVLAWTNVPREASRLVMWDLRKGTRAALEIDEPLNGAVYLSADGRRLGIQTLRNEKHQVQVINTTTGRQLACIPSWDGARRVALSAAGDIVAMGGESSDTDERRGEIQIWRVRDGKRLKTIIDPSTWGITALCFSPDGETLASGDLDGIVKRWTMPPSDNAAEDGDW